MENKEFKLLKHTLAETYRTTGGFEGVPPEMFEGITGPQGKQLREFTRSLERGSWFGFGKTKQMSRKERRAARFANPNAKKDS